MFKATPAMHRCRASLHKYCDSSLIPALTPATENLARFIAPTPMVQLRKWLKEDGEEFWQWLVSPPACDGLALHARDLAYTSLIEILELPLKRAEGDVDIEVLKAKQKAIDTVLAKNVPLVAIQNNAGDSESKKPVGISRQTPHQISERISAAKRHLPSASTDNDTIEGEYV